MHEHAYVQFDPSHYTSEIVAPGTLALPQQDSATVTTVNRWQLVKWEGDPPQPGEQKEPIEIIEGGDGVDTVRYSRK